MRGTLSLACSLVALAAGDLHHPAAARSDGTTDSFSEAPDTLPTDSKATLSRFPLESLRTISLPKTIAAPLSSHSPTQLAIAPILAPPEVSASHLLAIRSVPGELAPVNSQLGSAISLNSEPEYREPFLALKDVTIDFRNSFDNSGLVNRFIESTAQFWLPNSDKLRIKTGWNYFQQHNVDPINNIPLQIGWEHRLGEATLRVGGGIDIFDRLPAAPSFNIQVDLPIGVESDLEGGMVQGIALSGLVNYAPYKFNAKTLENQINVLHIKPNVYWQIDANTSFYGQYMVGFYNDGNFEQQSFSRLQRKLGSFYVAANLFTWNYKYDYEKRSGYFSPQDFLTYNGEVGWEGDVFDGLRCRLSATLGQQRLNGSFSLANTYNAGCTAEISQNIALELAYGFSNVRNRTNGNGYQSQSVIGQLRVNF